MDTPSSPNSHCQIACPLGQIPADFWNRIFKPPFRKRHPFIFWLGIIAAVLICLSFITSFFDDDEDDGREKIGIVRVEGAILDSTSTLNWINTLLEKPHVKGILLRINSPGGGAAASQEIYYALKRAAEKKPLVVSMGATAASGGLMVSMAGKRIFASPSTVTGSIGVRMDIPQLQGLMGKIGVGQETLVSGKYKDAASYTHPLTSEDRTYLQGVIDNMHEQFIEIVANGRKMDMETARAISNGKIYTGQQALELGLIDELGGQDAALAWICGQTDIPVTRKLLEKPVQKSRIREFILKDVLGMDNFSSIAQELTNSLEPVFMYR